MDTEGAGEEIEARSLVYALWFRVREREPTPAALANPAYSIVRSRPGDAAASNLVQLPSTKWESE